MFHLSYYHQLLEDVEDTLSCTTFEEDSLSRKLNCKGTTITLLFWLFLITRFQADWTFCLYYVLLNEGDSTSCWVKLNMEALKKEYQIVQSKRLALGKTNRLLSSEFLCLYTVVICHCTLIWCFSSCPILIFSTEMRRKASPWQRNLGYPLAMLMLLALTVHTLINKITTFCFKFHLFRYCYIYCCIIAVYVSSGYVCTYGLFQCVGVAPG